MTMAHAPTPDPHPPGEAAPAGATSPAPSRIDWLFRDALRHRQIHPLMELLRRHRQQEAS
jgi:hypothetical protein